jgi:hypothetical protein
MQKDVSVYYCRKSTNRSILTYTIQSIHILYSLEYSTILYPGRQGLYMRESTHKCFNSEL